VISAVNTQQPRRNSDLEYERLLKLTINFFMMGDLYQPPLQKPCSFLQGFAARPAKMQVMFSFKEVLSTAIAASCKQSQ
jgi:hypothetical protein